MNDPNTITIPADLWGILRNVNEVRAYRASLAECDGEHVAGASLLGRLADEIERQRPRPEGWYHVKDSHNARVLQWDGTQWSYGDGPARVDPGSTITPVTIGDPS